MRKQTIADALRGYEETAGMSPLVVKFSPNPDYDWDG